MDGNRRAELERIMAALAAGDRAMVLALFTAFGEQIRAALVALGREARLEPIPAEDLSGLTLDVCFTLERLAPAWDPAGGAVPWVWARHRLLNLLRAHAGPPREPLQQDGLADRAEATVVPSGSPGPVALAVLEELATRRADVAMVRAALRLVVPDADVALLLAHAEQVADGDPSPSVTVASMVGRSPAAVRKAVQRSRRRLADLAERDAGFRPLLHLALLGPAGRSAA